MVEKRKLVAALSGAITIGTLIVVLNTGAGAPTAFAVAFILGAATAAIFSKVL